MTKLYISPRNGEFGKVWTRKIGRAVYYFELRKSPAGRRLMVMRNTSGTYGTRRIVHWLYDCNPDAYEAAIKAAYEAGFEALLAAQKPPKRKRATTPPTNDSRSTR